MTIDEAIKHAEEVAEENEKLCYKKGGDGGYFNEDIDWNNTKCAAEHRQLAEWLKELKAHREAWEKVKSELWMEGMNMAGEYQGVWVRYRDIERVIDTNRPKDGGAE